MSMSKDEKKRKFIDLTVTEEPLSKRHKQNDNPPSSDEKNSDFYMAHVVNVLPQSKSFGASEVRTHTIPITTIPVDTEETIEQLQQRVIEIDNSMSKLLEIQRQLHADWCQSAEPEIQQSITVLLNIKIGEINKLKFDHIILQKKWRKYKRKMDTPHHHQKQQ